MKKYRLLIILIIIIFPVIVNGKTCDIDKISIEKITMKNKTDNVEEISKATASGKNINLNLFMSKVGDNIEYKLVVKNNSSENYKLDNTSLNIDSNYINYSIETEDHSNIVKSKSSKNVLLRVEYKKEVPKDKFKNGTYSDNKTMTVQLSNGNSTVKNPNTGVQSYILLLAIIILASGIAYVLLKRKERSKCMILIIGISIIVPISVYALCKYEIKINSSVSINENSCHFSGNLIKGAEYVNGQYTYRYMQVREYVEIEPGTFDHDWVDSDQSGWAVILTDATSTEPVTTKICSSINGKDVVSMRGMFLTSKASSIDLSSFNNLNVTDMSEMFAWTTADTLDLSKLDTSNVTNMSQMFQGANASSLDISNFNTSKVTDMTGMFAQTKANNINVSGIDTRKVTSMLNMFVSSNALSLDLSGFNTSNVETMYQMFSRSKATTIDVSHFNTSKVIDTTRMFQDSKATILDLSSFDTSNIQDKKDMFKQCEAIIGYARTQEDVDRLNNNTNRPSTLTFVVKD